MKKIGKVLACLGMVISAKAEVIRIGMIGLDTSHVVAFTETINNPKAKGHVPGAKVIAAFKGGSPDIESSASRVDGYTKTLQEVLVVQLPCHKTHRVATVGLPKFDGASGAKDVQARANGVGL